jgi:hypothetical protein
MQMSMIVMAPGSNISEDWEQSVATRIGRRCHVMQFTWVVESYLSPGELRQAVVDRIGPDASFLVAPLSGVWEANNCMNARTCYG